MPLYRVLALLIYIYVCVIAVPPLDGEYRI